VSSKYGLLYVALIVMLFSTASSAFDGVKLYATPAVGANWLRIKSMEIEKTFVSLASDNTSVTELANEDQVVGSKSFYTGSGVTPSVSAGIKLFSLGLGFHFAYTAMKTNKGQKGDKKTGGYYKEYRYSSEYNGAVGNNQYQQGTIGVKRIMFELLYGLPVWRFEFVFTTRVGGCMVDPNKLQIGRAISTKNGIAGELGMRIEFYPLDFLGIGFGGGGGFFAFAGTYEGTYGGGGGFSGNLTFRI
jgi:hypothetical protein